MGKRGGRKRALVVRGGKEEGLPHSLTDACQANLEKDAKKLEKKCVKYLTNIFYLT